jgi:hypothetical protein
MLSRLVFLLGIGGAFMAAVSSAERATPVGLPQTGACSMRNSALTTSSLRRLQQVVTDTAEYWRTLRTMSGLESVGPSDLHVVTDTMICRRAVRAFHAFYDSTTDSAFARSVDSDYWSGRGPIGISSR